MTRRLTSARCHSNIAAASRAFFVRQCRVLIERLHCESRCSAPTRAELGGRFCATRRDVVFALAARQTRPCSQSAFLCMNAIWACSHNCEKCQQRHRRRSCIFAVNFQPMGWAALLASERRSGGVGTRFFVAVHVRRAARCEGARFVPTRTTAPTSDRSCSCRRLARHTSTSRKMAFKSWSDFQPINTERRGSWTRTCLGRGWLAWTRANKQSTAFAREA